MSELELQAKAAVEAAIKALADAAVKCGEAGFSFMNVQEPLLNAHHNTVWVLRGIEGKT